MRNFSRSLKFKLAEDRVLIFFFILLFITLFLQFFTRYVLNNSFGWTEEIARVLLICLCFIGAAVNAREGTEISIEFLPSRLPEHYSHLLTGFVIPFIKGTIYLLLAVLMAYYSMKARQYLSTIYFPKKYIALLVSISFFIMSFHAFQRVAFQRVFTGGKDNS